jgi:hypothetical protein
VLPVDWTGSRVLTRPLLVGVEVLFVTHEQLSVGSCLAVYHTPPSGSRDSFEKAPENDPERRSEIG